MFQEVRRELLYLMMKGDGKSINIRSSNNPFEGNNLNHISIFDLPSENSGRAYLARLLAAIGFVQHNEFHMGPQNSDYICMVDETHPQLPKLVLADFRVRDMPKKVRNLMRKFTDYTVPFDHLKLESLYADLRAGDHNAAKKIAAFIYEFITARQWVVPTLEEYKQLKKENEMLAWVVACGRKINCSYAQLQNTQAFGNELMQIVSNDTINLKLASKAYG